MYKKLTKLILGLGMSAALIMSPAHVAAADIIVNNPDGQPYGAHEIWAHSEMGQSFVAEAVHARGGFFVSYSPESAALMQPNAPVTDMILSLYAGVGLNPDARLYQTTVTVNTTQNGFLDMDLTGAGVALEVGRDYTIGISSPYNRGWIVPGVCDWQNLVGGQPTGIYDGGHPFFQGVMVTNEVGICDNAFHMLDTDLLPPTPTPTPTVSPTPTPTPSYSVTDKKAELKGEITEVGVNSITAKRTVIRYDESTVITWNYNTEFLVGQFVQVKGFKNSDGTVTATKIEVN